MKTLKFFVALLLVLGFAFNNANSQNPVREVFDLYYELPFDCMGQTLTGTLTVERTFMNNHRQVKIYGTLTGTSDGLEYYAEIIAGQTPDENNVRWDEWGQKAITLTWPGIYHISRDGKLIAIIHFAFHYTVNANGEWTSYHGDAYECNLVGEGKFK
jgi:hypothetical protein